MRTSYTGPIDASRSRDKKSRRPTGSLPPTSPSGVADRAGPTIGVDVGTSATKVVLIDPDGRLLDTASTGSAGFRSEGGAHERDPDDWWDEVASAVRTVAAGNQERVAALSFTGQMLGVVALSGEGRVVRPAILWADARADDQANRLIRRFLGPVALRALGGGIPTGKDVVPKLLWLAEHEPDHHRRTDVYLDVVGYLVHRATGALVMEHSAAAATGLLNRRTRQWSPLLARAVSVEPSRLPSLVAPTDIVGGLAPDAADALGLPCGIPVVAAGGDAIAATVGAGARPMIQVGTSGWVAKVTDQRRRLPPAGVASLCWVDPDRDLEIAVSEAVGPCLTWITRLLYDRVDATGMELLDREVDRASVDADGMVFAPWLIGERSPINDADIRGALVNIGVGHGRAELARAVMEGIALNLRWMLDHVEPPTSDPIRIGGGVARSDQFVQIVADVTGRTIERVADPQHSTAVGAALTGLVATRRFPDITTAGACVTVDRQFRPSGTRSGLDARGRAFRRLPRLLKGVQAALHREQQSTVGSAGSGSMTS